MTAFSDRTCFVLLDDNESELVIAEARFRKLGLRNRLIMETEPRQAMRRISALLQSGSMRAEDIVVLLDIRMPGKNGFELIYEIRNDIAMHAVKIVMLSASRSTADQHDAEAIGADGYIVKPFTMGKLTAALAA